MNNKEWLDKASPVLKEYLTTTIGYPNCSAEQVMGSLAGMWETLDKNGLIKPGMTYNQFIYEAQKKYTQYEINRILGI